MDLHAVLAVLGEAAAEAAAERLEIDVVAVVPGIVTEEHRGGVGAVGGTDRGLGNRRRERADHHVDDALARVGARRDRGGKLRIDQAARRRVDLHQIDQALIVRHLRIKQRLERVEHAGLRRGAVGVDVSLHLRTGAGEVEEHFAIAVVRRHGDAELDGNIGRADAVVVHHVVKSIFAGLDAPQRLAQPIAGAANDLVERGFEHRHAPRLDHFRHAADAEPARRDLREIIAAPLFRHARIEQQQIENVVLQLAFAEQPDQRNTRAFLIDLGAARHAARRDAADVGVMRDVADEAARACRP